MRRNNPVAGRIVTINLEVKDVTDLLADNQYGYDKLNTKFQIVLRPGRKNQQANIAKVAEAVRGSFANLIGADDQMELDVEDIVNEATATEVMAREEAAEPVAA